LTGMGPALAVKKAHAGQLQFAKQCTIYNSCLNRQGIVRKGEFSSPKPFEGR